MSTCSVEGCERPVRARGWCPSHHARWLRHGDLMVDVPIGKVQITAETRKKLSDSHRGQVQSPETVAKRAESLRKAWANDNRRKPRGFDSAGYRTIGAEHEHPLALFGELSEHRKILYDRIGLGPHECHWGCGRLLEWGGIGGIVADHIDGDPLNNASENLVPSCTSCNMRRGRAGNPSEWSSEVVCCPQGHEYTSENTYVYRGGRSCRECRRERTRQWRIARSFS